MKYTAVITTLALRYRTLFS